MSSSNPHRIDPPSTPVRPMSLRSRKPGESHAKSIPEQHDASVHQSSQVHPSSQGSGSAESTSDDQTEPTQVEFPSRNELLELHAGDLIDRLQTWATDLDAREAQLNARSSLQDHRERRFRLVQQDASTDLVEQQRAVERLRAEIEAQARRLAFKDQSETR